MLTVRVRRRGRAPLRVAIATAQTMFALVVAHVGADGTLPDPLWLALMAGTIFGFGLLVVPGRLKLGIAIPALLAAQLGLHLWLSLSSGSGHAGHGGGVHLDAPMLLAHVVGAVVTAIVWRLQARAVDVVLHWRDGGRVPSAPGGCRPAPAPPPARPVALRALVVAPRRGPPRPLVAT